MPPTRRSGGKRAKSTALPSAASTLTSRALVRTSKIKKQTTAVVVPARCPLLEMPPELRNRIYSFCEERTFNLGYGEWTPLRKGKRTDYPYSRPTARIFFGLTQACQQIRAEYRPIWLRGSSVIVDSSDLADYIATFHSQSHAQQLDVYHAPKMMAVLLEHQKHFFRNGYFFETGHYSETEYFFETGHYSETEEHLDLKSLLKFRAFCEWFTVRFESRRLKEYDYPHIKCEECGQCCNCGFRCKYIDWCDRPLDGLEGSYDCPHDGVLYEVQAVIGADFAYSQALNCFLDNKNDAWLQSIRDDRLDCMRIGCTVGYGTEWFTIYIHFEDGFAPAVLRDPDFNFGVCQYLTDIGMIDLEERASINFVVGVGGRITRSSANRKTPIPAYKQIVVHGYTYEEPPGIIRSVKTAAGD